MRGADSVDRGLKSVDGGLESVDGGLESADRGVEFGVCRVESADGRGWIEETTGTQRRRRRVIPKSLQ